MSDKELAIKVAEKLGEGDWLWWIKQNKKLTDDAPSIQKYLQEKASQILFSEGMAGKIVDHVLNEGIGSFKGFVNWFASDVGLNDNNGTLTPQKILEVWLEIE
jgi:hypothetical protein